MDKLKEQLTLYNLMTFDDVKVMMNTKSQRNPNQTAFDDWKQITLPQNLEGNG